MALSEEDEEGSNPHLDKITNMTVIVGNLQQGVKSSVVMMSYDQAKPCHLCAHRHIHHKQNLTEPHSTRVASEYDILRLMMMMMLMIYWP